MNKYCFYLFVLGLISCVAESPRQLQLSETGKPALHAVQSERLRGLMRELEDLMFEHMLNEVQLDRQRRYQTEEIVEVSEKLLSTLPYIPNAVQDLTLNEQEQQIFLKLSEKLKQQVTLLKRDAEKNHVDVLPNRANRIVETCNACHHIFRLQ